MASGVEHCGPVAGADGGAGDPEFSESGRRGRKERGFRGGGRPPSPAARVPDDLPVQKASAF